jgi:SAM-dependent methyltransferase
MSDSVILGDRNPARGSFRTTREKLENGGLGAVLQHGVEVVRRQHARRLVIPVSEAWHNWRLGLDLDQYVETAWSAPEASEYNGYEATPWASFNKAMRRIALRPEGEVFVDVGCGKGKVLAMAARQPFRKVIGVELSPKLADEARANLERLAPKLRCRDVEVVTADASAWEFPDDVTVAFFFNPFVGSLLAQVCDNLERSLVRAPRPLRVVYANSNRFEAQVRALSWLEKTGGFQHQSPWSIYEAKPGIRAHRADRAAA